MSDDDFPGGAAPRNIQTPGKHRGPRFSWNPQYEETFFRALCESVTLGLREGTTFKPEAWDRAMRALVDEHNAYANKSHLINKSDNARKKFRLWRGLREDHDFQYDPATRTVTATDEAWRRHIEREPLSRSLKGRSFEHEQYYEILFPDVIGSGGAPKRITKPRRKTEVSIARHDEEQSQDDTPIMNLLTDATYSTPLQQQQQQVAQHNLNPNIHPTLQAAPLASNTNNNATPIIVRSTNHMAPRSATASSALTPPDEQVAVAPPSRKRQNVGQGEGSDKRRRTNTRNIPPVAIADMGTLNGSTTFPVVGSNNSNSNHGTGPQNPPGNMPPSAFIRHPAAATETLLSDILRPLVRAVRPAWAEQAVEIFFRDFSDEDPDLQLKVAEKALTDENKAMVFCKMSPSLRQHWVKKLRELHNRVQ